MRLVVEKTLRQLTLFNADTPIYTCKVALGRQPVGKKEREGDGKTPEGRYHICLIKPNGKYGRSLGLSYPNAGDAQQAYARGDIDAATLDAIACAHKERRRPPWGSSLGGEIYIHEGGTLSDWTQGCIALNTDDMDVVYLHHEHIDEVDILP